ncbi:MAG: UPF0149 family protein [Pseudomonadota bacterium]
MNTLDTPLNDQELDTLDTFLLERFPDEQVAKVSDDDNTGILNISELDGFMSAIISGPLALTPEQWLPVVWGDFEPKWRDRAESEAMVSLLLRHMQDIATLLREAPERFNPIVLEREEAEGVTTVVDDWCLGYMKGVALAQEGWREGGEAVMEMMFPILLFSSEKSRERLAGIEPEEVEVLKRSLGASARKVYAFWQARRSGAVSTFSHTAERPGRNDPCPCGSGRKYKKCCLH